MLNFKPNFKFSRLFFFWGGALPSLYVRQVAQVNRQRVLKFQGAAPPNGRNVVSRKISTRVGQYETTELFCLWTKVHLSFFRPTWKGLWLIKFFSDARCVDPFRIYLRSKSKVVKKGPKFGRSFGPRKFLGAFQKLYARYYPCVAARRLAKFREDIPPSPEVIKAHTLNFRPDF